MSSDRHHGNAVSAPRPLELAWAAGIFDGEGTAFFDQRKRTLGRPRLTVAQANREIPDRFCRAVGVGKVYGPYQSGIHTPMYEWRVYARRDIAIVVDLLWPWLSTPKRQQIKGMLAIDEEQQALRKYAKRRPKPNARQKQRENG